MQPRLIAFDLDGTLAESKQPLKPEMATLLVSLLKKMPVAIMSGAAFAQYATQFFPAFPAGADFKNLFIFPDNAAQCYVHKDGGWQAVYDEHFTEAEKTRIMLALQGALAETHVNDAVPKTWGPQIEDRGAQLSFSALGQQAPVAEKEKWHSGHDDLRRQLWERLVSLLPEFSVSMGGLTTIDITRRGITKAYGVEQLSKLTDTPVPEMLYVGDALGPGGNDAVVIETGIPTRQVAGPDETIRVIEEILSRYGLVRDRLMP